MESHQQVITEVFAEFQQAEGGTINLEATIISMGKALMDKDVIIAELKEKVAYRKQMDELRIGHNVGKLKEENEELKKENKQFKFAIYIQQEALEKREKEIVELKKENEELKEKNMDLKMYWRCFMDFADPRGSLEYPDKEFIDGWTDDEELKETLYEDFNIEEEEDDSEESLDSEERFRIGADLPEGCYR